MRAGLLALLEHGDGHLTKPFGHLRVLLEQLAEANRASQAGRASADGSAERLRELLREREVVGRAETAAAGDDHVGVLDRGAARLLRILADELHGGGVGGVRG